MTNVNVKASKHATTLIQYNLHAAEYNPGLAVSRLDGYITRANRLIESLTEQKGHPLYANKGDQISLALRIAHQRRDIESFRLATQQIQDGQKQD